jgi:hypothetical protein
MSAIDCIGVLKPGTMSGMTRGKDLRPRKRRTDKPKSPLVPYAQMEGRTSKVGISGMISPDVAARLAHEGRSLSRVQQLERAIKRLIELESEQ